ncbi:DUF1365 domain-containing protein [Rubinisphaera sp.]|uniref:DUF1365 domain-containing protein n=1 Tax=Rubinisphaera sp. TaxID=2024857 RepID=UPI000C1052C2|nr:DUF1365 domain-containing protein [Rubinisphaera sp.]MBV08438.1 chromosome partitioning protein ParA [Rubinisphaera sp.]
MFSETTGVDPAVTQSSTLPASCLFVGQVSHVRERPVRNVFRYRLFMLYLDLEELPTVFDRYWLWSAERNNVAAFYRKDHLRTSSENLLDGARNLVEERLGFRPQGPIRLLTHLRYYGFMMNPVSFYFCYDNDQKPVAMIAEVNNTPWGEQHCYVMKWDSSIENGIQKWEIEKEFHVSPFMEMQMRYRWEVREPGKQLLVNIANHDTEGLLFSAGMNLQRREINSMNLAKCLIKYPAMTLKVYAAIHWQALKLWAKGVKYVPHPE